MVGNRIRNSHVWAHFVKVTDGGRCNICYKLVKGKGGNTSNLEKHLRLKHNILLRSCTLFNPLKVNNHNITNQYESTTTKSTTATSTDSSYMQPLPKEPESDAIINVVEPSQASVHLPEAPALQQHQTTLFECVSPRPKKKKITDEQKDEIGRAITRYIVKEMQPFSTIASEPFRRVLSSLNPHYVPPNRETMSSIYVPAWYNVEIELLKTELALVSGVGVTADHWTSLSGDHYLTVTAHYVLNWKLHNKVLATKAVYESQTGQAIDNEIREILMNFDVLDKVKGITVDNAANMAAGARSLEFQCIPCFAHCLNIAASKLYNETSFTRWLARIRSIVLFFKRVHMARVVLKEKLKNLELPNHAVILDVKTRWNSMYLMVERFSEVYPALSAACRDPRLKNRIDKDKIEKVNDSDLKKGEDFVETMKILYTSTLAISTDKIPTVGQIIPTWNKLEKFLSVTDSDSEFIRNIKTTLWKDMSKRYKAPELLEFLEEASAFDPRFKSKVHDEVWERLEDKLIKEVLPETTALDLLDLQVSPPPSSPVEKRKRSAIEDLFLDEDNEVEITEINTIPSPLMLARAEIQKYRSMPKIKMHENPLDFYKTHNEKLPMISALACQYFCVSGSSVPSERIFSLAGNTISQERVRLDPEKADMLIFLHKNAE